MWIEILCLLRLNGPKVMLTTREDIRRYYLTCIRAIACIKVPKCLIRPALHFWVKSLHVRQLWVCFKARPACTRSTHQTYDMFHFQWANKTLSPLIPDSVERSWRDSMNDTQTDHSDTEQTFTENLLLTSLGWPPRCNKEQKNLSKWTDMKV